MQFKMARLVNARKESSVFRCLGLEVGSESC